MKRSLALWWVLAIAVVVSGFFFASGSRRAMAADDTEKKASATFEVYKDKGGEFRWRLRTQNTQVIASSGQSFSSKKTCLDSIESVKKHAADAAVKEVEEPAAPAKE